MTLLEQALKVEVSQKRSPKEWSKEEFELVMAYMNGVISEKQFRTVKKLTHSAIYYHILRFLRDAVKMKKIKIEEI